MSEQPNRDMEQSESDKENDMNENEKKDLLGEEPEEGAVHAEFDSAKPFEAAAVGDGAPGSEEEVEEEKDDEAGEPEKGGALDEPDDGVEDGKPEKVALLRPVMVGLGVAAAVAVGLGAWALTAGPLAPAPEVAGSEQKQPQPMQATLNVVGDAVKADTTDFIVRFEGKTGEAKGQEVWRLVPAAQAIGEAEQEPVTLAPGSWEVTVSPTFNADGSMNKGTGKEPIELKLEGTSESQATGIDFAPETVAATDVAQEARDKAVKKVEDMAADAGDSVVSADALTAIKSGADASWAKAQEAAAAKKAEEDAKKAVEEAGNDGTGEQEAAQGGDGGSNAAPQGGQAAPAKSSGGSGNGSKVAAAPKQQAHQHSWTPVYRDEPVFENRTVTVTVQEAWTETKTKYVTMFSDGHITNSPQETFEYQKATGLSYKGDYPINETINHPAVTQQQTQRVQTGTKQVLDHYVCSSCGATN